MIKDEMLRLHFEGKTVKEIAYILDNKEHNVRKILTNNKLKCNKAETGKITGKIRKEIVRLHSEGKTVNEISEMLGKTKANIRNQLCALGLKSNKMEVK